MGKKQKVLLRNVETNSCEVTGKQNRKYSSPHSEQAG